MTNFERITTSPEALTEFLDKSLNQERDDWDCPGCYHCTAYGTHHANKSYLGTPNENLYECKDCEWETFSQVGSIQGLLAWLGQEANENPHSDSV